MFLLIVLLFIFTIFAFVVVNKAAGEVVVNKGYKEYRLGDYSTWLQRLFNQASNWQKFKSCLSDSKFCDGLRNEYPTQTEFDMASLSPIQALFYSPILIHKQGRKSASILHWLTMVRDNAKE